MRRQEGHTDRTNREVAAASRMLNIEEGGDSDHPSFPSEDKPHVHDVCIDNGRAYVPAATAARLTWSCSYVGKAATREIAQPFSVSARNVLCFG